MKHIKLYEELINIDELSANDLKNGDFVIINSSDFDLQNVLMYLVEDPELNADGFTIRASLWDENTYHAPITFYDWEIVGKVVDKEDLEDYKMKQAAKKYNL